MKTIQAAYIAAFLAISPTNGAAASEFGNDLPEYQSAVMSILRLHLKAIEMLVADQNHPYTDNIVRHALALKSTAQLLDHIYPYQKQLATMPLTNGKPWQDQKAFTALVDKSLLATKELVSASEQWLKGNRDALPKAILQVRQSCDSCHHIFRHK